MKINGHNLFIGADPELFVKRFDKLISAHNLIPGSKEKPFPVNKGAIQPDGMAAEFNIDPADSFETFEDNMTSVLSELTKSLNGYELFIEPVADFGDEYIQSVPKYASELGCNPDYNAYTKSVNPTPDAGAPFRTASGHVHVGWTSDVDPLDPTHFEACCYMAKALDLYLGIPSLVFDHDDRRRQLYGKAGSFRPKSYGMEYRVLSNKWISNPVLRKMVYFNTVAAFEHLLDKKRGIDSIEGKEFAGANIPSIINKTHENHDMALRIALTYGGIKTPRDYRDEMEAAKVK